MEQEKKKMEEISASVEQFYDSLTDEELAEQRAWAEFAQSQFPSEDSDWPRTGPMTSKCEGCDGVQAIPES